METNPSINSSSSINNNNPSEPDKKLLAATETPKILPHHPIEDEYWKKFPVGYRFCPRDGELIVHYLRKKVLNQRLPPNKIAQVNIYNHNPEDLAEIFNAYKEDEAYYFFTPRDRKYRNGDRPSRAAGCGYWKATGANKPVNYHGERVGSRNALVFYRGKPPNGAKTDWIMHEFKFDNPPPTKRDDVNDMRLDEWVLCKIYYKPSRSCKARNTEENHQHPDNDAHHEAHQNESTTVTASTPSRDVPQLNEFPNDIIYLNNQNQEINNNKMIMESESFLASSKLLLQDDPTWNYYKNQETFGLHMEWNSYSDPYTI